jgi:hypothetical protein
LSPSKGNDQIIPDRSRIVKKNRENFLVYRWRAEFR